MPITPISNSRSMTHCGVYLLLVDLDRRVLGVEVLVELGDERVGLGLFLTGDTSGYGKTRSSRTRPQKRFFMKPIVSGSGPSMVSASRIICWSRAETPFIVLRSAMSVVEECGLEALL